MSHYSLAFRFSKENPKDNFDSISQFTAERIVSICTRLNSIPVLCYVGFSGISYATLVAFNLRQLDFEHKLMYVRKTNESTHGQPIEKNFKELFSDEKYTLFFLDDFEQTGFTREFAISSVIFELKEQINYFTPSCVNMYQKARNKFEESNYVPYISTTLLGSDLIHLKTQHPLLLDCIHDPSDSSKYILHTISNDYQSILTTTDFYLN